MRPKVAIKFIVLAFLACQTGVTKAVKWTFYSEKPYLMVIY